MRHHLALLILVVLVSLTGCGGDASPPPTEGPVGATPPQEPAAETPTGESPGSEYLSAHEAYGVAQAHADNLSAPYALYEVMGCHQVADPGTFDKAPSLLIGQCSSWLFRFYAERDEGFDELLVWVGPNGVLDARQTAKPSLVGKTPQGDPADWLIDSTQALAIAEDAGGRAHRESDPKWDPGQFESNRNAILIARLTFHPFFDSGSGGYKEIAGAKGCVWEISYPPMSELVFVVDANTGDMLATLD